jgi:hypothetical protein
MKPSHIAASLLLVRDSLLWTDHPWLKCHNCGHPSGREFKRKHMSLHGLALFCAVYLLATTSPGPGDCGQRPSSLLRREAPSPGKAP